MSGLRLNAVVKADLVRAALRRADKNSRRDAVKAMRQATNEVLVPRVKSSVPHASGRYASTIRAGATQRAVYVQARTPYAKVLELGRKPMTIRATGAALSTPYGPRRSVRSPRYPARHTLQRAVLPHVAATADRVETYLIQAIKAYL